jgi:Ca2+-binding EF-hand superfamily protein
MKYHRGIALSFCWLSCSVEAAWLRYKSSAPSSSAPAKSPDNLAEELTDQVDSKGSSFIAADQDKSGGIDIKEWARYAMSTPEASSSHQFRQSLNMCFSFHLCYNGASGEASVCQPGWVGVSVPCKGFEWSCEAHSGLPLAQFNAATSTSVLECAAAATEAWFKYALDPDGNGQLEAETFSSKRPDAPGKGRDVFDCGWKSEMVGNTTEYTKDPHGCDAQLECVDQNQDGVASFAEGKYAVLHQWCAPWECSKDPVSLCFQQLRIGKAAQSAAEKFFESYDPNKDGVLTMSEALEPVKKQCDAHKEEVHGCQMLTANRKAMFECADQDGDGKATQKEWAELLKAREILKTQQGGQGKMSKCEYRRTAFVRGDRNRDGKVDWQEFWYSPDCIDYDDGKKQSRDDYKECQMRGLRCFDKDGDGKLNNQEYLSSMDAYTPPRPPTSQYEQPPVMGQDQMCLERARKFAKAFETAREADWDESGGLSSDEMVMFELVPSITEAGYVKHCAGVPADADIHPRVLADVDAPSKTNPQQTMLECVANQRSAGPSDRPNKDAFEGMDANADGKVSQQEIYDAADNLPAGIQSTDVDNLMKNADADGNKFISRKEFEEAGANHKGDGPEALLQHQKT